MFGRNIPVLKRIQFDLQRKIAAHKTLEAWENIPHAGIVLDLDVTNLLEFVEKLKKTKPFKRTRLTINLVMLKIIGECMKVCPELNSYIDYDKVSNRGELIVLEDVNIAVPLFLPDGRTITPVVQQVQKKSLKDLCNDMDTLQARILGTNVDFLLFETARRDTLELLKRGKIWTVLKRVFSNFFGKNKIKMPPKKEYEEYLKIPETDRLTPDDLLSATCLATNIGPAFKGLPCHIALAEIIPPQTIVFGLASIRKAPAVIKNENNEDVIAIRNILPMTILGDHRAFDFGPAVGALRRMLDLCEHPEEFETLDVHPAETLEKSKEKEKPI